MHPYNIEKAQQIGHRLAVPLISKPNLDRLRNGKQISKAEQRVMDYLTLLGYNVTQQVLIPTLAFSNSKPRFASVDAVVSTPDNSKSAILEIDGVTWHSSEEAQAKDSYRDDCMEEIGFSVLRIPYDKPSYPIDSSKNQEWWALYLYHVAYLVSQHLTEL